MSHSPNRSAADLLIQRLAQWGVRHLFGYPGGQLTPIYDALYRQSAIRHYLARHEQAAGFMADGFARATGQPGVCLAVCGPGVYNAATPLATAHTDSIPVLLISGQVPRAGRGLRSGYYHENEQAAACAAFTRAQIRVDEPAEVVAAVDRAWQQLTTGRPGPVLLEVPVDVLREEVAATEFPPCPVWSPAMPDSAALARLAELLSGWQRPLLLAGGGVVSSGAESALDTLARRLGAPVMHTANGKCALPASHPLAVGMPWSQVTSDISGMAEFFSPLLRQADGLLAIGCRFGQLCTGSWTMPLPPSLAHIDIDPEEIGRHYKPTVAVVADARLALEGLLERLPTTERTPWANRPTLPPWQLPGIDVLGPLERVLPADTILCADVTRVAYLAMNRLPLQHRRSFLHPAGAVSMGYGLPAALGARAAYPDRPIVVLVGDGGLQMSALELASSVQERLPVVIVLINDRCLTLIKATQERRYANRFIAVDLHNPDFGQLASAFGVGYHRVEREQELEAALRQALGQEQTTLIEVVLP